MKRLFKFYQQYESDERRFSTCSTEYAVLPHIVEDAAGSDKLMAFAKQLGLETVGEPVEAEKPNYGFRPLLITHSVLLAESEEVKVGFFGPVEKRPVYLGFITVPDELYTEGLEASSDIGIKISEEQAHEIVNNQEAGVFDYGNTVDGEVVMVKEGWEYWHILPLLGYDLKSFEDALGITQHGFSDDTFRCAVCGLFDSNDNGYQYNYRMTDEGPVGIRCGCYDEYSKSHLDEYIGNPDKPIQLETAEKLEKEGVLEHIERFIGGMTDGRGGSWGGDPCREGDPATLLHKFIESDPEGDYLFSLDECGQFQTYFSLWKVVA